MTQDDYVMQRYRLACTMICWSLIRFGAAQTAVPPGIASSCLAVCQIHLPADGA
jgi:hypothetical protein